MDEVALEHLKHKLRFRELILDKLVLAVLLGAAGLYANHRLAQYENRLNTQLEQLKSVYNFQRILDQREVDALERAWTAIGSFRVFVDTKLDQPIDLDEIQKTSLALSSKLVVERLYLSKHAQTTVTTFFEKDVPELITRWSGDTGRGSLTNETWTWFAARVESVMESINAEIQAKRGATPVGSVTP